MIFSAFERLIAFRYLRARRQEGFISVVAFISLVGILLGVATLIDIFRAERDACLLGTDAVRDGIDVPGPALRLIVFDRVPWPRPSILHKARRGHFGGRAWDDAITRLRLKQGFGRLVRRAGDHGVFVLLDPMMPSRLAGAFPDGAAPRRVGLSEAVAEVGDFLSRSPPA